MSDFSRTGRLVSLVKGYLETELQEWLGHYLPAEGTEDHDQWLSKVADIENIQNLGNALEELNRIGDNPSEALAKLGVVPSDFTPTLGELHELLGQGLPPPPRSRFDGANDEGLADMNAYWAARVGKLLMQRWYQKLRGMGIDPHMKIKQ